MKRFFFLLTYLCLFGTQNNYAQDLATFYKLSDKSSQYDFAEGKAYQLTTSSKSMGSIEFEAQTNHTFDIAIELTFSLKYRKQTDFEVTIGEQESLVFSISGDGLNKLTHKGKVIENRKSYG